MAIIYSYPKVTSPLATDVLVLTDTTLTAGKRKNKTKSLALSDLANYVVSSTSGITGGGTLNTIPMWTPDGSKLGDSIMTQVLIGASTYALVVGSSRITETSVASTTISGTTVIATNITGINSGIVSLSGGVIIGNEATDILQITSSVSDSTGTGSTAAGQVLLSNAAGQLVWGSSGSGAVTGSGTTNTLPLWSDGPNGVLGDSRITQSPSGTDVAGRLNVGADLTVGGRAAFSGLYARFLGQVQDGTTSSGTNGQILSSTGTNVQWIDNTTTGTVTGTGTTNNLPLWSDGPNGVLGDSIITQEASGQAVTITGQLDLTGPLGLLQGNNNSFAGKNVGNFYNTSGGNNSAFGQESQASQTSGSNNTSVGLESMKNNLSGNANTAIGRNALIGNTTASFNTGVGEYVLGEITTGTRNVAIGRNAGRFISDGITANTNSRNSIFIGNGTRAAADNEVGQIVIGRNAVGEGTNTTVIGTGSTNKTTLWGQLNIPKYGSGLYTSGTEVYNLSVDNAGKVIETPISSKVVTTLIPTIIVGTPGGSSTFSTNNNIVELQWVGGNGTYVLNIPSAATIPYRVIRFAIDGSFPGGSGHRIDITAQSGETIDGDPSFELNKTYEGAAIWSTGTEWIVIQLKG